jgi:hypothetical protein
MCDVILLFTFPPLSFHVPALFPCCVLTATSILSLSISSRHIALMPDPSCPTTTTRCVIVL